MSNRYLERLQRVEGVLLIEKLKIDMKELKSACSYGIPDLLRPIGWRLLLNYLPAERQLWKQFLKEHRANYDTLVEQLILLKAESEEDHPLNESTSSEWKGFFEDNVTLAQIDKDVRRLCPEIQFFQQRTLFPHKSGSRVNLSIRVTGAELEAQDFRVDKFGVANLKNSARRRASNDVCSPVDHIQGERHWQVVERILFIYSKLNPGVKYVQGMNEVIGPLYYVFASDSDKEWAEFAEADTFYCFQQLMTEIKDNFIRTLDDSQCGIESMMRSFHELFNSFDAQLHQHMVIDLQILPQFYAFRWLSLLLSQEFALPDVITLWDSLFADTLRFSLLPYVCLAMIESQRDYLLSASFAESLRLLQNFPEGIDVGTLVCLAHDIREGRVCSIEAPQNEKKTMTSRAVNFKEKLKEFANNLKK
ncbi:unnamed protein product, partial [Mesorhabditis belari]|uniref:Rab-GAP TBC domain-containing protein n=1 Tax=Mesorhabditis belari TaxID=2138241 RepID=A0AAF3FLX4_9BILA